MITLTINIVPTQDYQSETLIMQWVKLKPKMFMKVLVKIKKCLILFNYYAGSKYDDDSNKLVVSKMKDELGSVAIKANVPIFGDDSNEHKESKSFV